MTRRTLVYAIAAGVAVTLVAPSWHVWLPACAALGVILGIHQARERHDEA